MSQVNNTILFIFLLFLQCVLTTPVFSVLSSTLVACSHISCYFFQVQTLICPWNMQEKRRDGFVSKRQATPGLCRWDVPLLRLRGSVPLPSVFEPVADLRGGQSCGLGQLSLFPRGRVRVVCVPLSQDAPGLLLKAVAGLLAVPYRAGQREFPPHPVLPHGSERPAAQLLRLHVVRLQPELLQLRVVVRRKLVAFQDLVELSEVPPVKGHHRLGFEDAFVLMEVITGG